MVRFLVEKGIDAKRLQSVGHGPDKPIEDNKTAKGREKNRRVDFVIIDPPQAQSATPAKPIEAPEIVDKDPDKKHSGAKAKKPGAGTKDAPAAGGDATKKRHSKKAKPAKTE